jgi:hypothetical protein
MKKTVLLLVAFCLLIACKKETKQDYNLHISGNIEGIKQGKLYIQKLKDTTLVMLDSIIFDGQSKFDSYLTVESPEMLYFFLDRGQTNSLDNNLVIFAEPGKLTLNTTVETFYADAQVKGSKNNELYLNFKKIQARFNANQLDLVEKEIRAKQANDQTQLDSVLTAKDQLLKRKYLYAINYALSQKDFEVSPYIALSELYDAQTKYLDTIHNSMSPKVAKSKYGKILTDFITKRKKEEGNYR